jgi:hypothetical protein
MHAVGTALPLAASGEAQKAGPLALAVILVLAIACYFLFRSMTRHLRKVRTQFPVNPPADPLAPPPGPSDPEPPASTVTPGDSPTSTDRPDS